MHKKAPKSRSKAQHSKALELYKALLTPRLIEEKMLSLLRQNKISKWFSGIGQEAISIGVVEACSPDDVILPMHRNLGVFTHRKVPFYPLFCQLFGKADGFSNGRERSFHFGTLEHGIVGMISHLAAMMPVADGLALARKLRGDQSIAVSFCGDGATSEGDFHEALNLAAVWKLPVVFVIENNGYGLSTPTNEQFACKDLVDRAKGYGIKGFQVDGNDVFDVLNTMSRARKLALKGTPVLIEAMTFRMRGHEEASGTAYVPDDMFNEWSKKDPISRMEQYLADHFKLTEQDFQRLRTEIKSSFNSDLKAAIQADEPVFDESSELQAVYAPTPTLPTISKDTYHKENVEKRYVDAIRDGLYQGLKENPTAVFMGQDIAGYGGVFKISEGFLDEFGSDRIRNTPIIESGILGAGLGLSLDGFHPVIEMQFADFVSCGMNQIIQNIAKSHYRWSPPIPLTIRLPYGAGVGAGPFHSQSPEGWFMPHAGLKILVPSSVKDAQDMLYSALFEPNPVLLFEHKKIYRSVKEMVPSEAERVDFSKAYCVIEGQDASIITYGMGVHWAKELSHHMLAEGVNIEVIDLRCLSPIDWDTVLVSVKKTHRVLLLQEASETMGPMSEIAAYISEHGFNYLDAPIIRVSSLNTPIPFNKQLEQGYLAHSKLENRMKQLLSY